MDITPHPLVGILRLLARLHPEPWHYQRDPDLLGWRPENVPALLSKLRAEGLVEKVAGPAVALTAEGVRAVGDPGSLDRVARGVPVNGPEPSAQDAAGPQPPAWAARAIVLVNIGVFLWGLWIATSAPTAYALPWLAAVAGSVVVFLYATTWLGPKRPYLSGLVRFLCVAVVLGGGYLALNRPFSGPYLWGPKPADQVRYLAILHRQGAVTGEDVMDGAWWRLVTAGFVHAGFLSVAMNLWALWGSAAFVERAFGWWRLPVIYLFGCLGGGCAAMAHDPASPMAGVGAWDASCGVLGAMAVYALLHGHRLPKAVVSSLWWSVGTSALVLGLISFMAMRNGGGLSVAGLLGGAAGGAAAAALMYFQRYGGLALKVAALLALVPLAWGLVAYLQSTRGTSVAWEKIEDKRLMKHTLVDVYNTNLGVVKTYDEMVDPLIEQRASRRNQAKVRAANEEMTAGVGKLRALSGELGVENYRSKEATKKIATAKALLDSQATYYAEAVRYLEAGESWTREEERAHVQMWDAVLAARKSWLPLKEAVKEANKKAD